MAEDYQNLELFSEIHGIGSWTVDWVYGDRFMSAPDYIEPQPLVLRSVARI
jgi:hypothetical protein